MLRFLGPAQIDRLACPILDVKADGVLVELDAGVQVSHVEHDVAAPDDVERRIEDVRRHGHMVRFRSLD